MRSEESRPITTTWISEAHGFCVPPASKGFLQLFLLPPYALDFRYNWFKCPGRYCMEIQNLTQDLCRLLMEQVTLTSWLVTGAACASCVLIALELGCLPPLRTHTRQACIGSRTNSRSALTSSVPSALWPGVSPRPFPSHPWHYTSATTERGIHMRNRLTS